MTKSFSNSKPEVTGVGIHKAGRNAAVPSMTVNQRQIIFAHFPCLVHDVSENPSVDDFTWMIAVKVDFHCVLKRLKNRKNTPKKSK